MRPRAEAEAELELLTMIFYEVDSMPLEVVRYGWCTEEWQRWQQGYCDVYAIALLRLDPSLQLAVCGETHDGEPSHGWDPVHVYARDDRFAYDSAGRHELPYVGIDGQCDYYEDAVAEDWGWPENGGELDIQHAMEHATRNGILQGRYPLHEQAARSEALLRRKDVKTCAVAAGTG